MTHLQGKELASGDRLPAKFSQVVHVGCEPGPPQVCGQGLRGRGSTPRHPTYLDLPSSFPDLTLQLLSGAAEEAGLPDPNLQQAYGAASPAGE